MNIKPQNVLDYYGNNAIFMVWNFKKDLDFEVNYKVCYCFKYIASISIK
jgi:porphyrinogen peroxidase